MENINMVEICKTIYDIETKEDFIHDPFLVITECASLNITFEEWEKMERQRSIKKLIEMKIGKLHELVITSLKGWRKEDVFGVDVVNEDNSIFIELKNKYNEFVQQNRRVLKM